MLDKDLARAFARFDVQAWTYIGKRPPNPTLNIGSNHSEIFLDLKEAEDALFHDLHDVWTFFHKSASPSRYLDPESMPELVRVEFKSLQERLRGWKRAFLSFEETHHASFSKRDAGHASLLHIHHSTGTVSLVGELSPNEMVYDTFDDIFQSIVCLSNQLLRERLTSPWSDTFSIEMGIVQPLYITAVKCRVHHIRAEAIKLLGSVPRPEGIWNGRVMAKIAEQVRIIEEGGLDLESLGPESLPEFRRVHSVGADINQKARTATYFCNMHRSDESGKFEDISGTVTW